MKAKVYVNQDKSVSDLQTLIKHSFLLYFPRELLMSFLNIVTGCLEKYFLKSSLFWNLNPLFCYAELMGV